MSKGPQLFDLTEDNRAVAIRLVEDELVGAKREARDYEERGLPVPDYVTKKIENLKGAAVALRKGVQGEVR